MSGQQKAINYLIDFVESNRFTKMAKKIREKYDIPLNGFPVFDKDKNKDYLFKYPEAWRFNEFKNYKEEVKAFNIDVKKILEGFLLRGYFWNKYIRFYIFHNKLPEMDGHIAISCKPQGTAFSNLCQISDFKEQIEEYGEDYCYKLLQSELDFFPISLKISPYATRNDMVNYIDSNLKFIEYFQNKYKKDGVKLGKLRTKKNRERDGFIYKHRKLPRKEISKLVKDKFNIILGQSEINKIISLEKKRRSE